MPDETRWESIYDQIHSTYAPDSYTGAGDESSAKGALGPLKEQICQARSRLYERTGLSPDTDPDLKLLIRGLEDLSRACGKLMYHYGYLDGVHKK